MNRGNYAISVASGYVRRYNMERILTMIVLGFLFMFLGITKSFGQKVNKGHEHKKGEMNFSEVAKHFKEHPQKLKRMKLENEEDEEKRPDPQPVSDPSLIRKRAAKQGQGNNEPVNSSPTGGTVIPSGSAPVSNAPAALFESTLDNGTTIPPDTHGAVDSNYCITTINSAVKIQTRAGAPVSSVTLNQFWLPVLSSGGAFDPRAHYDPYTNRWFIIAVSGANSTSSSVLIAVSKTSNPTGGWWMYKILADPSATRWLDFPNVGFNKKWLTVTGNLFGSSYGGAKVFIFDKASLMSGVGAPYTAFTQTSSFTICPAITYDNTQENQFAVESWNGGSGVMHLWKISGAVGSESMTTVSYPANTDKWRGSGGSSSTADFAPQAGISNKLQTNDDRVTQMIFMNNKLWFAHTVFLPYNISAYATRSAVQWWQTDTTGTPLQIGRVDDSVAGNFYAFPSIAVNTSDDAVIGFSLFSASIYPSAGYTLRMHTDGVDSMRPVQVYKPGLNSYYKTYGGSRNRWGDYSSTCIDPVNMKDFWTIQEVASATANVWDTWWANVTIGGCSVAAISGSSTMCVGNTTSLTDATSGGAWSSSNTAIATVSSTGVVSAIAAGAPTITYAASGCSATKTITVNTAPAAIGGSSSLCAGTTTTLTNTTTGGTWSSSNSSVASVGASGIVSGVAAGTATITYSTGTGCNATQTITVNAAPAAISGSATACAGTTMTWSSATAGGTWSSSNTSVATITSTGVVSAIAPGTSTVTYAVSGCSATKTITVNAAPGAISGGSSVCAGASTTFTNTTTGGTWSSSNTTVASVGATGIVSGVSAGVATISYSTGSGCTATKSITVNATPAAIGGSTTVCTGGTTALSNTTSGGSWSSSNTAVATVSTTGVVSGLAAGTTTITYAMPGGCAVTAVITVSASPSAGTISGSSSVTTGATITLTSSGLGGTWSSSNTAIATVSSGGVVAGVAAGTANITYGVVTTCGTAYAIKAITVTAPVASNAIPVFTGGASQAMTICQSSAAKSITSMLSVSDADAGQTETWSVVSAPAHGTLGGFSTAMVSTGGTVTPSGLTYTPTSGYSGTDAFTVKVSDGIASSTIVINVTVSPAPVAGTISGPSTILASTPVTFTCSGTPGGTWSSSNAAIASIGATTGVATGIASGNVVISRAVSNSCGTANATMKVRVKATGNGKGKSAQPTANDVQSAGATVYPNPVKSTFTLVVPDNGKFYLFNMGGNMVAEYGVTEGDNSLSMKGGVQPGIYLGKFVGDDGSTETIRISYEP